MKPGLSMMVAADADEDMIADDHGYGGGGVVEFLIRDADLPALFAIGRVEADEVAIGRFM